MKIRQGIIFSSVLIILFIAISCSLSYYSNAVFNKLQLVRANNETLINLAEELRNSSANLTSNVRNYVATKDKSFKDKYNLIVDIRGGAKARPSSSSVAPGESIALLDLLKKHGITDEEFALLQEANNLSNKLIGLETEAMQAIESSTPNQMHAIDLVFGKQYQAEVVKIMVPIGNFFKTLTNRTNGLALEMKKEFEVTVTIAIIFSILTLITSCIVFLLIYKNIVMPIVKTTNIAEYIAKGNLTLTTEQDEQFTSFMKHKNELADLSVALKTMIANLAKMVLESDETSKQAQIATEKAREATEAAEEAAKKASEARKQGLQDAANRIEGIVGTISAASVQLSTQIEIATSGAEEQSARLTETATAMEEMNCTVLEIAQNSGSSAERAEDTKQQAGEGAQITKECENTMANVRDESLHVRVTMNELADHAQSINAIMGVISDIADQTNLLALNAAIEAARAGEAGRGFAVVADEVRKLAEKTITSTADVATAITAIQQSTEVNVKQVDSMVNRIENVTNLTVSSGEALNGILLMAEESADGIRAIATASEEQSATSDEIAKSIVSVTDIASGTSEAMLEASRVVQSLTEQTHELSMLVDSLKND